MARCAHPEGSLGKTRTEEEKLFQDTDYANLCALHEPCSESERHD